MQAFGDAPVSELVRAAAATQLFPSFVDSEQPFFNLILRFACGEAAAAVLADQPLDAADGAVLGTLDVFDALEWISEDFSMLSKKLSVSVLARSNLSNRLPPDGKQLLPVAAFTELFYAPAVATSTLSVCSAFAEMATRRISGLLVTSDKLDARLLRYAAAAHQIECYGSSDGSYAAQPQH